MKIICFVASRQKEKTNSLPHKHSTILQKYTASDDHPEAMLGAPLSTELEEVTLLHCLPARKPWAVCKMVHAGVWRAGPFFVGLSCLTISVHVVCSVSMTSLTADSFHM